MSDPQALYARTAEFAQGVLADIDPARLDDPSPCDGWDVRDAVNHLIGGQHYFAACARGQGLEPQTGGPPDFTAGDMVEAHEQAARACAAAFTDAVMTSALQTARGEIPGGMLFEIAAMENVLHAWDAGRGAGLSPEVPEDIAEAILGVVGAIAANARGDGDFADPVEVGEDASMTDRILALSGRTP